jgi:hypothetical protein
VELNMIVAATDLPHSNDRLKLKLNKVYGKLQVKGRVFGLEGMYVDRKQANEDILLFLESEYISGEMERSTRTVLHAKQLEKDGQKMDGSADNQDVASKQGSMEPTTSSRSKTSAEQEEALRTKRLARVKYLLEQNREKAGDLPKRISHSSKTNLVEVTSEVKRASVVGKRRASG